MLPNNFNTDLVFNQFPEVFNRYTVFIGKFYRCEYLINQILLYAKYYKFLPNIISAKNEYNNCAIILYITGFYPIIYKVSV